MKSNFLGNNNVANGDLLCMIMSVCIQIVTMMQESKTQQLELMQENTTLPDEKMSRWAETQDMPVLMEVIIWLVDIINTAVK